MDSPADPVSDASPPMVDSSVGRQDSIEVAVNGDAKTDGPDGYVADADHVPDGDYAPYSYRGGYSDSHTSESQIDDKGYGRGVLTPIAICGMACRLPGGINSPRELWDFLVAGRDARGRVPESRYNINAWIPPVKKADSTIAEYGYFLDESVGLGALDTSFFSMSHSEVERMDPQQRMLLEVAREALEDSCEVGWQGENIGVYCGTYGQDWHDISNFETQKSSAYQVTAMQDLMLSERVSHELDLRGPSVTFRTACSSSLIALNDACMAIARGDCKSAIIGGTNIVMSPTHGMASFEQGRYSPDGSCKTFSEEADGYARGEAIVAVYVKPLREALLDGSPVRAVVSGTAANSDGKTIPMSMSSFKAQEALIRRAYEVAGILDIGKTALFECHGTGFETSDLIETNVIGAVFGESGIYISSVKPNLGHAEGAAGLVALVKAVLCLEHRTIPPNIKLHTPNPKIPWETAKLKVAVKPTPWPSDRAERISINSFNVGGAHGHCILESAASFHADRSIRQRKETSIDQPRLFVFSANTPYSLSNMLQRYQAFLEETIEDLNNVAFTLANKREHLPFRSFIVGSKGKPGVPAPVPTAVAIQNPSLVMVFTGQGAQWPQMGRDLLRSNLVFRNTIKTLDRHLLSLGSAAPRWSLEQELHKPIDISRVDEAEFSQPLCTAVQIGLVDALAAVGLQPAAVIGHSTGEFAAAYAAGALTAKETIVVASYRGTITKLVTERGGMAAVGVGREEASQYLVDGVVIAFDDSHSSVTLSGDVENLERVVAEITKANRGVLATMLNSEKAYHSHHMVGIGQKFHRALEVSGIKGKHPTIPFFSSVTGKIFRTKGQVSLGPQYWRDNLESTVRFRDAVCSIFRHPGVKNPVFLEVGPHPVLASTLRQICTHELSKAPHVATLVRQQHALDSFLTAIAKLYTFQIVADFKALMPIGSSVPDLPPYPWDHQQSFWYETRVSKEWRMGGHPYHDLLGSIVHGSTADEPIWRNLLMVENVPWLADHITEKGITYPVSAFLGMAAEALQQTSVSTYHNIGFRRVFVVDTLVVSEDKNAPSELVTVFHRHRLTDSLDSEWWDFSISSHDGHGWTKHCTGEVRAEPGSLKNSQSISDLPRKVSSQGWYHVTRRHGLDYGKQFQTLQEVTASTVQPHRAKAKLHNNSHGDEASYYIHPVVVESYFQLLSLAARHGRTSEYRRLVPKTIQSMTMSRCSVGDFVMSVVGEFDGDDFVGHGAAIIESRKTVLQVFGARMVLQEGGEVSDGPKVPITARSEFVPDIEFEEIRSLVSPVHKHEEYALILKDLAQLAVSLCNRLATKTRVKSPHLEKYKAWLAQQANEARNGDDDALESRVDSLVQRLGLTPAAPVAAAIAKVCENIVPILSADKQVMEALSTDMRGVEKFMKEYDNSSFLRHLGHTKPNLQVLELGAGRGDTTVKVLKCLTHARGQPLYSRYVLSDVLTAFTVAAKKRFRGVANMEFVSLDIDRDLSEIGFENRRFDIIIATGVLHQSPNIQRALGNISNLLTPRGRLLLQDPLPGSLWTKLLLGTLPGWWCSSEEYRAHEPYLAPQQWNEEMRLAGLEIQDGVISDAPDPFAINSIVIAKRKRERPWSRHVTLLCRSGTTQAGASITSELEARNYKLTHCTTQDMPPQGQDVISLLDIEQSYMEDVDQDRFSNLKAFVSNLDKSGIFWITRPCQVNVQNPRYAPIIGFSRTVRNEMAVDFATCEVGEWNSTKMASAICDVFRKFQQREMDGVLGPDYEYAIDSDKVLVNRIFPFRLDEDIQTRNPSDGAVLSVGNLGYLDSLAWLPQPAVPPKEDEIQMDVYASALNLRDIIVAMGQLKTPETSFGYEAAGVVRRVGPNVTRYHVGDRVIHLGVNTMSTAVTASEMLFERLPDEMSFEDGATMPLVFATAIHGLLGLARLSKGQSVLIHSGTGSHGLAAIQIARMLEADIHSTVSNDDKARYLTETFGISPNHIYNSRSTSFVDDVLRETGGKGVDVALNSVSGELLHATWSCIAKWGTMVEIGSTDLIGAGKLDMQAFLDNRSYCGINVDQMVRERPEIVNSLLGQIMEYYRQRHIKPIRLARISSASEVRETFEFMNKGRHIGKVMLQLRDDAGKSHFGDTVAARKVTAELDGSASYLLIGGLGELGRSISVWMVQHGARNLTFLSRSAGSRQHDKDFKKELESMGCNVRLVRGNVISPDDVAQAVDGTAASLKGIVHMAMIHRDQALHQMTIKDWNECVDTKIKGAWNLHEVTRSRGFELDFFVLFSSLSGIVGQQSQVNVAAASTFLDAFVQYRESLQLPATGIALGAMESVNYSTANPAGWRLNQEGELFDALNAAITLQTIPKEDQSEMDPPTWIDKNKFMLGTAPLVPLSSPESYTQLRHDARMAVLHNISDQTGASVGATDDLRAWPRASAKP